jgi:hypothetical protein
VLVDLTKGLEKLEAQYCKWGDYEIGQQLPGYPGSMSDFVGMQVYNLDIPDFEVVDEEEVGLENYS